MTCPIWAPEELEPLSRALLPYRVVALVWHPADQPAAHRLYSDASAAEIVPALRAILARLESGALRMPVTAGDMRWVDEDRGDADPG